MKTVLFVDDEAQILRSLVRLFRDSGHKILCASSGKEALALCGAEHVDMVVSDMRMPEMNGVELLRSIKQNHPQALRMILSGYSDESVVIEALQNNIAMAYIIKPWDNDSLGRMINGALDTGDHLASAELLQAVNAMDQLPTLKPYLQDILNAINSDKDIAAISSIIEHDQSIASKVLHIVNSAYYGIKTGSVQKAVSFLGLHNIKTLILSTSVMDSMEIKGNGKRFAENMWAHSFDTNKIQQAILAPILSRDALQMTGAAGLLHNIGIVFLIKYRASQYLPLVTEAMIHPEKPLALLEMERMGFTHGQAGGYLLQWWNLPFPIAEAALYHDNPADGRILNQRLVAAMHIAQHMASEKAGMAPDCSWHPEAYATLGISREQLEGRLAGLGAPSEKPTGG